MCGFLRKIVHGKDIFLLKNKQQKICHCYISVGYAKTKKSSNPPQFLGVAHFCEIREKGEFFETVFSKGIYTTLIMGNEKQKNLKTTKYLQQLKYPSRNLVGAFLEDKKIIAFRKSEVGTLKSIFDGTLVNTKIKLDTSDACLQQKSMQINQSLIWKQ